ncbi:MAG: RagB/SusD family nutrient uptake outer membrane protein [Bacteroidales bacterium]
MKKIKIFTMSLILLVSSLVQSCNDDYMDRFPKTEIGRENFFNTRDDLQMYVNSLINWTNFGWSSGIFIESSDDAYTTGSAEFRTIMTQPVSSSTITAGWNWGRLRDINFFLENFEKANIPQADLDHFEGVARFHRARFYMGMVQRFGDVPWYGKVLDTDDEDLYKPRDPREFVVQKIFEDYEFAAQHVRSSQAVGSVDLWVVKTFMARHALYEGTYRKYHDYLGLPYEEFLETARNQAKDIIDNGGFDLYSTGDPDSDYGSLFSNTNLVGNPEVILVNRSVEGERNSGWPATVFGGYEQSPSKDLLQSYLMADGSFYSDQADWETKLFVEEFENRDPRLYQTYAYPGWVLHNPSTHVVGSGGEPYVQQFNKHFTGYHVIKYFVNDPDPVVHASIDIPVLRYAEVLLTYAEAKAELGELTQTDLDITINRLRDRAGMPHLTMDPPVDPVQQARYPGLASSTAQWAELLEIRRERRIELTHESRRFNDLMRYRAGHLLENEPEGLYFPALGNYDLTGDGYDDVKLIPHTDIIPPFADREVNELGVTLVYYRTGPIDTDATVFLENGDQGNIQVTESMGTFEDPKHYYRPVPQRDTQINPNLEQIFGWE